MKNKLYKLTNGLGNYYVIAQHPTEAEEKLLKMLNDNNYGTLSTRQPTSIELIATEATDKRFITNHYLLT